jgi:hypothetical protein
LTLAALSAIGEAMLYWSVLRHFSSRIGLYMLIMLCFSPGMFIANQGDLLSSFYE